MVNRRTARRARHPVDPPDALDLHDESIVIAPGETRYVLHLNDDEVEALAAGICSERLARVAHQLLGWKREAERAAHQRAEPAATRST